MKKGLIIGLVTLLLLAVGYSVGIGYYAEKFQANTTFGTIDISNLTLTQAQEKIKRELSQEQIKVTENGKELGTFTLAELNGQIKSDEVLTAAYQSQNPIQWITSFFSSIEYDNLLMNYVEISDGDLSKALMEMGINNSERTPATNATIEYSEARGYYVEEARSGEQLDLDKVKQMIVDGLQSGEETIEVNTAYLQPEIEANDEKINEFMEQIDEFSNTKITLEIAGNDVTIPKEEILKWIQFDESNKIILDQEAVYDYLGTLNEQYATYNKSRQFVSTLRGTVTIQPGTLGWSINREAETAQIIEDIKAGKDVSRMPVIAGSGYSESGGDDIGNTYVEVDMENQMMYYYQNGEVLLSTPVVTGMYGSSDTIPGAYSIWSKQENAILRGTRVQTGTDYEQPVAFWMPFDDTGQGIHDASWQSNFGGTAYLQAGSQGCINTPPGVMAELYAMVAVGTPVIIH